MRNALRAYKCMCPCRQQTSVQYVWIAYGFVLEHFTGTSLQKRNNFTALASCTYMKSTQPRSKQLRKLAHAVSLLSQPPRRYVACVWLAYRDAATSHRPTQPRQNKPGKILARKFRRYPASHELGESYRLEQKTLSISAGSNEASNGSHMSSAHA